MRKLSRVHRTICAFCLMLTTIVCFGANRPFSPMFALFNIKKDTLRSAQSFNRNRYLKALDYFNETKRLGEGDVTADGGPDIVVVVVTVARVGDGAEPPGYLIQTAAALHAAVKTDRGALSKLVVICNAEDKPARHGDAVFLQHYLPYIHKEGSSIVPGDYNRHPTVRYNLREDFRRTKEIEDYVFCINSARNLNSKYLLVMEDDVIPMKDAFNVIEHTLRVRFHRRKSGLDNFSYLKLYYPQRWQGFAFETVRLLEVISIGVVGGLVLHCLFTFTCHPNPLSSETMVASRRHYVFWTLATIALAELVGRVPLMELRRLSPWLYKFGPAPACCSQAVLYPSRVVPQISQHLLLANTSSNKDLALHDFTVQAAIPGYQLEPNLFLHTGMHTSLSAPGTRKKAEEFLFDMPFDLHALITNTAI